MEGHSNEITQSLWTSRNTLGWFSKPKILLATSLCVFCGRVIGVEQRGGGDMQLPFDTGVFRLWRWSGAHAEGYRD